MKSKKILLLLMAAALLFSCRFVPAVDEPGLSPANPLQLALGVESNEMLIDGDRWFKVDDLSENEIYSVTIGNMKGDAAYWDLHSVYVFSKANDANDVANELELAVSETGDILDGALVQLEKEDTSSTAYFTGAEEVWIRVRGASQVLPTDLFSILVQSDAPPLSAYYENSILYLPREDGMGYDEIFMTTHEVDEDGNVIITLENGTIIEIDDLGTVSVTHPYGRTPEYAFELTLDAASTALTPLDPTYYYIGGLDPAKTYNIQVAWQSQTPDAWDLWYASVYSTAALADANEGSDVTLTAGIPGFIDGGDLVEDNREDLEANATFTNEESVYIVIRRGGSSTADNFTVTVTAVE